MRLPCDRRSDEDHLDDLNADLSDGLDLGDVVLSFLAGVAMLVVFMAMAYLVAAIWGHR